MAVSKPKSLLKESVFQLLSLFEDLTYYQSLSVLFGGPLMMNQTYMRPLQHRCPVILPRDARRPRRDWGTHAFTQARLSELLGPIRSRYREVESKLLSATVTASVVKIRSRQTNHVTD